MLRPGGTLAVWGYGLSSFVGEPEASEALRALFEDVLGPYWDPKRALVEAKYIDEALTWVPLVWCTLAARSILHMLQKP